MRAGPRRRQQQQRQRELPRSPGDGASGAEVNDVPPGGPSDENHAKWCRINVIRRGPPSTSPAALLFALGAQPGFRRGLPVLFVIKMAVRGCPQLLRSSSVRVRAGAGWRAVLPAIRAAVVALQPRSGRRAGAPGLRVLLRQPDRRRGRPPRANSRFIRDSRSRKRAAAPTARRAGHRRSFRGPGSVLGNLFARQPTPSGSLDVFFSLLLGDTARLAPGFPYIYGTWKASIVASHPQRGLEQIPR